MNIDDIIRKVSPILKKHNIKKAGIFGSFSRMKGNDTKDTSDVDILVQLGSRISLLDFIGIKLELEDILHRKVDLVEYKAIKPILRDDILAEEIKIL